MNISFCLAARRLFAAIGFVCLSMSSLQAGGFVSGAEVRAQLTAFLASQGPSWPRRVEVALGSLFPDFVRRPGAARRHIAHKNLPEASRERFWSLRLRGFIWELLGEPRGFIFKLFVDLLHVAPAAVVSLIC